MSRGPTRYPASTGPAVAASNCVVVRRKTSRPKIAGVLGAAASGAMGGCGCAAACAAATPAATPTRPARRWGWSVDAWSYPTDLTADVRDTAVDAECDFPSRARHRAANAGSAAEEGKRGALLGATRAQVANGREG